MASTSNSLTIVQQIYRAISGLSAVEDTARSVRVITDLVQQYLAREVSEYPPCRFFVTRVRNLTTSLECTDTSGAIAIAVRVQRAIHRLEIVKNPSLISSLFQENFAETENVNFTAALERPNGDELYGFCSPLTQLEISQVYLLFDWAFTHWKVRILNSVLEACPLDSMRLDPLVEEAFKRGMFEEIACFVMLLHFENLSTGSMQMIEKWLDGQTEGAFQEIASLLSSFEERLRVCMRIEGREFVVIHRMNSKRDLEPMIKMICGLFGRCQEVNTQVELASVFWRTFLDQMERDAPISQMIDSLESAVSVVQAPLESSSSSEDVASQIQRMILGNAQVGDFRPFLELRIIQNLPKDVRERLFLWANTQKDEEVLRFFVAHDLLSPEFLELLVSQLLSTNSFSMISDLITEERCFLLSKDLVGQIQAWRLTRKPPSMQRSSPPPNYGEEEKFDVHSLHSSFCQAVEGMDEARLRKLLANSTVKQLPQDAIRDLIYRAVHFPNALRILLSDPTFRLNNDEFTGLLFEVFSNGGWQSLSYLLEASSQYMIEIAALIDLNERAQKGAPETVQVALQLRIQSALELFDDEPA